MKRISRVIVIGIFLFSSSVTLSAQKTFEMLKATIVEPYPLLVTFNKTTNLIFPYAIKSVDRGSRDILVQKAKGVENILLVKAGRETFPETNLSVITADGKLYSFLLNYSGNPTLLNIAFTKDTLHKDMIGATGQENREAQIEPAAGKVANKKRTLHGLKDNAYEMRLRLNGIYIKNDILYFQLELRNFSSIAYDIDLLRFFIRDEKKAKREASQEIELPPLFVYGDTSSVKEQSTRILVFAVRKFTIPDKKYLLIQLMERNGGRHLHLDIRNRTIVKAKRIGG
jgi:conjugative transposon TraN protein